MKTIKELRSEFNKLSPKEIVSRVNYLKNQMIDFNVFLPSIEKPLQRDLVWNSLQKRELIMSILIGRHIPHLSIINRYILGNNDKDHLEIIDGKQRLSTIFQFIDGLFPIEIDDTIFYFKDLPEDYQIAIEKCNLRYYIVNEESPNSITDQDKIDWFRFINYCGTPQDKEHMDGLMNTTTPQISNKYNGISTEENYNSLKCSGMFWEFYPELSGVWEEDKLLIFKK